MKKRKLFFFLLILFFSNYVGSNPIPVLLTIEPYQPECSQDVILYIVGTMEGAMAPCIDIARIYRGVKLTEDYTIDLTDDNTVIVAEFSCDEIPFDGQVIDRDVPPGDYFYQMINAQGDAMSEIPIDWSTDPPTPIPFTVIEYGEDCFLLDGGIVDIVSDDIEVDFTTQDISLDSAEKDRELDKEIDLTVDIETEEEVKNSSGCNVIVDSVMNIDYPFILQMFLSILFQ